MDTAPRPARSNGTRTNGSAVSTLASLAAVAGGVPIIKSLREGRANLSDGYAYIDGGQAWLDAVHIPEYSQGHWTNHSSKRTRKLLLHKDEIDKLSHAVSAGGYTLVPLKLYFLDGRAKVELAVAKGKREYDKRQTLRERQDKREAERAMRTRNRMGE